MQASHTAAQPEPVPAPATDAVAPAKLHNSHAPAAAAPAPPRLPAACRRKPSRERNACSRSCCHATPLLRCCCCSTTLWDAATAGGSHTASSTHNVRRHSTTRWLAPAAWCSSMTHAPAAAAAAGLGARPITGCPALTGSWGGPAWHEPIHGLLAATELLAEHDDLCCAGRLCRENSRAPGSAGSKR